MLYSIPQNPVGTIKAPRVPSCDRGFVGSGRGEDPSVGPSLMDSAKRVRILFFFYGAWIG